MRQSAWGWTDSRYLRSLDLPTRTTLARSAGEAWRLDCREYAAKAVSMDKALVLEGSSTGARLH